MSMNGKLDLTFFYVPKLDCSVIASAGDEFAVWFNCNTTYEISVALKECKCTKVAGLLLGDVL